MDEINVQIDNMNFWLDIILSEWIKELSKWTKWMSEWTKYRPNGENDFPNGQNNSQMDKIIDKILTIK